jgi:hypothetical protein
MQILDNKYAKMIGDWKEKESNVKQRSFLKAFENKPTNILRTRSMKSI